MRTAAVIRTVLRDQQLRKATLGFTMFSIAEHATWLAIIVFAYSRGGVHGFKHIANELF